MTDYAERLRNFNRAGRVHYELLDEAAVYIKALEVEANELEYIKKGLEGRIMALEYAESAAFAAGYEAGKNAILKVDGELYKNLREEIAELRHRLGDFDEEEE